MADKYLHIVCLDVPYPADYGGVFDLFYKIKSLHENGIHIHLHCFEYGRGRQSELNKFCESVTYYKRKKFYNSHLFSVPYMVGSRASRLLLNNIMNDDFPVLLEGIHCTYFLYTGELKNRKVFVRLHNVECEYYEELAKSTDNLFKKLYCKAESFLLKKYEKAIANKASFFSVSEKDANTYMQNFNAGSIQYLPVFLPFKNVTIKEGAGNFCLYHGNLSVPENEKAALWLATDVFNDIDIPFVIAGKNPSPRLTDAVHSNENFCIIENPSADEMNDLVEKAHVHVLPSLNTTGIKIKLLNALFAGKFILTNKNAVRDTGFETLCSIAEEAEDYKKTIKDLFQKTFTKSDADERIGLLNPLFDNDKNAQKLIELIW